jgi:hypothetical protein
MPREAKPVSVEEYRRHVTSVAQRVQGAMRAAQPGQLASLWDTWPALAGALVALDLELNQPVIRSVSWPTSLG